MPDYDVKEMIEAFKVSLRLRSTVKMLISERRNTHQCEAFSAALCTCTALSFSHITIQETLSEPIELSTSIPILLSTTEKSKLLSSLASSLFRYARLLVSIAHND